MSIPRAYRLVGHGSEPGGSGHADEFQPVLTRFAHWLAVSGRSPTTARIYTAAVRRWLSAGGRPGHLDGDLLASWLRSRRRTVSDGTVNVEVKALGAFYRCQELHEDAAPGTAARLPRLKHVPPRMPRAMSADQVEALLRMPDTSTWIGARDRMVLVLLIETGIRAGELCRLTTASLLDDGTIFVHGKGGRDRYVPASPELQQEWETWLVRRAERKPGKRVALLIGRHGRGITTRTVRWIVDRHSRAALGRALGLHTIARQSRPWSGYYPHLLRATAATEWHRAGMPVGAIAETLGHTQLATTGRYVAVDLDGLKRAIRANPRTSRKA